MNKLFTVCLTIALLSLGIAAQEVHENRTEAVLMILDKESNLPICRLSDQVVINSEFILENRIDNVDMASTQDVRVCEEEDVWVAVEEEMLVGMAVAPINPSSTGGLMTGLIPFLSTSIGTFICFLNNSLGRHRHKNPRACFLFFLGQRLYQLCVIYFSMLIRI